MMLRNRLTLTVVAAASVMTAGCATYSDFTLPTPDGREMSLGQHQGKVVLLAFWGST